MFGLIRRSYWIWIIVFVLYPLLSAWPQELIYRAFMFQRYRRLFTSDMAMIIASEAAFAFLHVLFRNWLAIGLTFIAGIVFAMDYHKTKALTPAFIEHALYGNLIFTIGLGYFFYQGAT